MAYHWAMAHRLKTTELGHIVMRQTVNFMEENLEVSLEFKLVGSIELGAGIDDAIVIKKKIRVKHD